MDRSARLLFSACTLRGRLAVAAAAAASILMLPAVMTVLLLGTGGEGRSDLDLG